jgi:cell shape-determining protein MreC
MPVREMTYLFVIIALSVINALSLTFTWAELIATNVLFFLSVMVTEWSKWLRHVSTKTIKYDRIELITPERRTELKEDLTRRTGLNILKVEVGDLDFLKDMAIVRISYEPENHDVNTADGVAVR